VDAQVINLGDATLLPGLIDCHVHLTLNPKDLGYESLGISVPRQTISGVANAFKTLRAGFTTARDVGAAGFSDVALRDAIQNGEVPGPRLQVSGPELGITGGHGDNNLLPYEFHYKDEGIVDGPWEARGKVRETVKYGVDLIKIMASGGVFSKGDVPGTPQYSLEEMKAIVEEAHRLGRKVAAHAHGTVSIKEAILAGTDSIEHASFIDEEGMRMARERGTILVMDIYNHDFILQQGIDMGMLPESIEKEKEIGLTQRENFRKAVQSGVPMAFGTDGGIYPHGVNARQFYYMIQYGMTPMQAIKAATLNASELMGWQDQIGTIEKGKLADIIAVRGDPISNIRLLENTQFVMKGGEIVKNEISHR
ncbi:amidohydrolase family protein, partial [bacterium]|nr:amidohydrolase family protein [bacterium]